MLQLMLIAETISVATRIC